MKNLPRLITIAVVLTSCITTKNSSMTDFAVNQVVAHRGAFKKNGFPENSIASLKEAIRLNCTGSEFDVRMSADDTLVINHDPDHRKLPIEKTSYADLAKLPLSNGETLPTLRQYILTGLENNKRTRLVVEIKPSETSKEHGKLVASKTVNLIRELKAEAMVVYISFDYDILKKIIEIDHAAQTQYLNGDKTPAQLKADGITGADYHISVFKKNPEWIEQAHQNKIILNAWTVNDKTDMQWLLEKKFDFITTNEPELLLSLLKQ
jgi:glycerophosphoryl diester phosphodiesterase